MTLVLLLFIILYQSIHLPPLIRGQSGRGGRSLNFPAQTSFIPATSSSSCGETPRHSKASRESLPECPEHFMYYYFFGDKNMWLRCRVAHQRPWFPLATGLLTRTTAPAAGLFAKGFKEETQAAKVQTFTFFNSSFFSPPLTRQEKKEILLKKCSCCVAQKQRQGIFCYSFAVRTRPTWQRLSCFQSSAWFIR